MVVFRAWDGDDAVVVDVMEADVSSSPFPTASSPPSSRLEALLFDGALGVFKKSKSYGGKNLFVKPKVKPSLLKMKFGCEVVVDSLVVQPVLKKQVAKRPWFDDSPLPPLKRCKVDGVLNVVDGLKVDAWRDVTPLSGQFLLKPFGELVGDLLLNKPRLVLNLVLPSLGAFWLKQGWLFWVFRRLPGAVLLVPWDPGPGLDRLTPI